MIDPVGRQKLMEDIRTKKLVNGIADGMKGALIEAFKNNSQDSTKNKEVLELVVDRKEDKDLKKTVDGIGSVLVMIAKSVMKPLPKIFHVKGDVSANVTRMPPVEIKNLNDLKEYFDQLSLQIAGLSHAVSLVPQPKIEMPKIEFPKMEAFDPEVRKLLEELIVTVESSKGSLDKEDIVDGLFKVQQAIETLANKPQMTAQPVTNINVNALNGAFKATRVTIGTSPTALPNAALPNRRGIVIYNASANTIYLGGSTVAVAGTGQGLPILTTSASPAFDAGANMTLYGIATVSSVVNVLEMSSEASGR